MEPCIHDDRLFLQMVMLFRNARSLDQLCLVPRAATIRLDLPHVDRRSRIHHFILSTYESFLYLAGTW